jgi:hypothetical protein
LCLLCNSSAFDDAIRIANSETTKAERAKLLMDATDLKAIEDFVKSKKLQLMVRGMLPPLLLPPLMLLLLPLLFLPAATTTTIGGGGGGV